MTPRRIDNVLSRIERVCGYVGQQMHKSIQELSVISALIRCGVMTWTCRSQDNNSYASCLSGRGMGRVPVGKATITLGFKDTATHV